MDIVVRNASGKPIYEQIASQIKNLILGGALKEGGALPSMRRLAQELRISVITTKRAYEELEREGLISSVPGKGSFVACKDPEWIREEHLRMVEELLRRAADMARRGGISLEELTGVLAMFYEEEA
ncbi:MAG: GntR family transcriptional regulator [Oscillospiraceae bacterium]|nr:GntR family transcriptional regulator [Oscillospiraceae bacterium]